MRLHDRARCSLKDTAAFLVLKLAQATSCCTLHSCSIIACNMSDVIIYGDYLFSNVALLSHSLIDFEQSTQMVLEISEVKSIYNI